MVDERIIYDEESMYYHFSVDIPSFVTEEDDMEWQVVQYFKTKEEAIAYAMEHYGADENGMICLISSF